MLELFDPWTILLEYTILYLFWTPVLVKGTIPISR